MAQTSSLDRLEKRLQDADALPPCIVLSGDEILLATEAADAVRHCARRLGSTRTHLVLDARSDWSTVLASSQNGSLFGESQLLEISVPSGRPGKSGAATLQTLAEQVAENRLPDTRLLINLPRLDRNTRQSKWARHLQAHAEWVDIPAISRDALSPWLASRLRRQEQSAPQEVLAWLADQVEGNLLAAHQEIQKLALLYPKGALTADQVQSAVLDVARYNLFDLRDAMLLGDGKRALAVLDGLRAEGQALPLVLWAVGEETRLLNRLARQAPEHLNAALRQNRIFGARERLVRRALQRAPARLWPRLLGQVHDIDCLIKGIPVAGRLQDPWDEIARLITRVSLALGA